MRRVLRWGAAALVSIVAMAGTLIAQEETKVVATPSHVLITPGDVHWGAPPPVFEQKGAQFAVLSGDPGKDGPFVVRLKMMPGYRIAPHWHPTDEHVTVLSGTFMLGMGETFNRVTMKDYTGGSYVLLPTDMRHYAMAKTPCVVQVHGMGPFAITYVNPADDPSKKTAESPSK